ncbi:MAG: hypothetical protein H0T89_21720 [Deltaproteobacteria bacterium]|nr:hypothetical protein [Deltaproteobacteria bacterium]MDQ3296810.1 hypothetical protein [Myxococcota bacterium]
MPYRLALGCAVFVAACGQDVRPTAPDAPVDHDAGVDDASDVNDALADAGSNDASPDAPIPDTSPPNLLSVIPAAVGEAWLHEPIRFEFDEPIDLTGAVLTVTLAGSPITAMMSLEGDRTVAVTLDPAARGRGTLEIQLGGVRDLAGNGAPVPVSAQHAIAAWSRVPTDRGTAAGSPVLAVGASGRVVAAWSVGSAGSRRIVVSELRGTWQPLGSTLGAADTSSPAITLDALQRPVVAWIEGGTAQVMRWSGTAWDALPSPGMGTYVLLATPPAGGAPTVAVVGTTAAVKILATNDTWEALGGELALGGALASEPALAVPAAGRAAIGWIAGNQLVVHRYTTSWTAMAAIAIGTPPSGIHRMSLAARDDRVAIAWDQYSASFSVYAAMAGATSAWTRLGRTLDVDVAGNAAAPAIAIDTSGNPVVAWSERIETTERGVLARWDGSAWTIVGGPTWLAATTLPTRPTLALHLGNAAVVGWSLGGAIHVSRFNGPRDPGPGMTVRASINGCALAVASPPATLLATGCFSIPTAGKPTAHAGLVPYDIVNELWTDGTRKRRWIGLPDGGSMTTSATEAWTAPVGSIIVKEFAIETTPGNTATRRAVETRFLVNTAAGWLGFTYRWRANGSDADLLNDGTYTTDWALDGGGTYRHLYPSRSQCLSCHENSYGPLLGLRAPQLARWADYDGVIADQLPTLVQLGLHTTTTANPFIATHDASASFEQRARSYMAANCAHCHNPNNIAVKDLRYTTPLGQTKLCTSITPGSPSSSDLYVRVTSRPGMPALGTLIVDPHADEILARWISGMTSCP